MVSFNSPPPRPQKRTLLNTFFSLGWQLVVGGFGEGTSNETDSDLTGLSLIYIGIHETPYTFHIFLNKIILTNL